jgi:hypothetical protein
MENESIISFNQFLTSLGPVKFKEIGLAFKHQFKIKDNFLNANSKNFVSITTKF